MLEREPVHLIATLVPALWLGAVLAISFMEAPLKFRAPHAPRIAALSIGQVVFRALIRVEMGLLLIEAVLLHLVGWPRGTAGWFAALAAIVGIQRVVLLPPLDRQASAVLAGQHGPSNRVLHTLYAAGDCLKLGVLPGLCWTLGRHLHLTSGG